MRQIGRLLWLLLGTLCLPAVVHAMSPAQDSLMKALAVPGISNQKALELTYALADSFFPSNIDSVLKYTEQGLARASLEGNNPLVGKLHYLRGFCKVERSDYVTALEEFSTVWELGRAMQDTAMMMRALGGLGNTYFYQGKYDKAAENEFEILRLAEEMNDSVQIARAHRALGVTFGTIKDNEKSIYHTLRSIEISEAIGDVEPLGFAYNNIAIDFKNAGQMDKAIFYYNKGLDLARKHADTLDWSLTLSNLGTTYAKVKEFDKAKALIEEALKITENRENKEFRTLSLQAKAELEFRLGNYAVADEWFQKALEIAEPANDPGLMEYIYRKMVEAAEEQEIYDKAFAWQKVLNSINDSIMANNRMETLNELQVQYEMQEMNAENARLLLESEKSKSRQRQFTLGVAAGAILLITLIGFMAWYNRRSRRHNRVLSEQSALIQSQNEALTAQNQQLNQLNEEMSSLMGIVAHDLKAPFSKAEGLLQILDASQDEMGIIDKMKKIFRDGKELIGELVLLNELETQQQELLIEPVDPKTFAIETLSSFEEVAAKKQIQLHFDVASAPAVVQSNSAYLKRILDNLVSNAIKFSPAGKNVWISLGAAGEKLAMEVRDEGPGIPSAEIPMLYHKFTRLSNRPTAGESSTGLGLSIVKSLVDRLGGKMSVDSTLGEGTTFRISIPGS